MPRIVEPDAPVRSVYDTEEIQQGTGSIEFFYNLSCKDRWWTNCSTPRRLRKGDSMQIRAIRVTVPRRLPAEQVADIFHAALVEFRVNRRSVVELPLDQFDTVQIVPDDYHLPNYDDPETMSALEALAGKKLFLSPEWPPSNGVNRATLAIKPVGITSEHDIGASVRFGPGCPHPCLIRFALVGPYQEPVWK